VRPAVVILIISLCVLPLNACRYQAGEHGGPYDSDGQGRTGTVP
jgi:hypothetical protein